MYFGDITKIPTDSIASSVDATCIGKKAGVNGAIHRANGYSSVDGSGLLQNEILKKLKVVSGPNKRCPAGKARAIRVPWHITTVNQRTLKREIKYILLASGPTRPDLQLLASTYWATFARAKALGVRDLAVPCIAAKVFGNSQALAASVAVKTAKKWIDVTKSTMRIVFVVVRRDQLGFYRKAIKTHMGN